MAKFFKPIMKLCTPAKVYLVLSLITIVGSLMAGSYVAAVVNVMVSLLWAFFLGWLCDKKLTVVSWIILFMPVLVTLGVILLGATMGISIGTMETTTKTEELIKKTNPDGSVEMVEVSKSSEGFEAANAGSFYTKTKNYLGSTVNRVNQAVKKSLDLNVEAFEGGEGIEGVGDFSKLTDMMSGKEKIVEQVKGVVDKMTPDQKKMMKDQMMTMADKMLGD